MNQFKNLIKINLKNIDALQSYEIDDQGSLIPISDELNSQNQENPSPQKMNNQTNQIITNNTESLSKQSIPNDKIINTQTENNIIQNEQNIISEDDPIIEEVNLDDGNLNEEKSFSKSNYPTTSQSVSYSYLQREKNTLENKIYNNLNIYFSEEISFILPITFKPYLQQKDIEDCHQKLLYLMEAGEDISEKTLMYFGYYYYITYRDFEGIKLIEKYFHKLKKKDYFYNLLGIFYHNIGMYDNAKSLFKKAIKSTDHLKSPHISLGSLYLSAKKYQKALDHFKIAENTFIETPEYLILVANAHEALDHPEKALFFYELYLKIKPEDKEILKKVANLNYSLEYFENALYYFNLAEKQKVIIINITYRRAMISLFHGEKEKAIDYLMDILKHTHFPQTINPSNTLLILIVNAFKLGIFDPQTFKAIDILLNELKIPFKAFINKEIKPETINEPDSLLNLAKILIEKKKYQSGIQILKKLLNQNKKNYHALRELSKVYYFFQNKKDMAYNIFFLLDKKKKTDREIDFYLAMYYFDLRIWNKAIIFFEKAINKNFYHPELYNKLVDTYKELGDHQSAKYFIKQAILKDPENIQLKILLGMIYFNANENNKAIRQFKKIIEIDPENKLAHYYLSKIYKDVLHKESKEHYSKYLDL